MAESLNEQNRTALLTISVANLVLFFSVIQAGALSSGNWQAILNDLSSAVPASLALIVVGVLNAQLSSEAKSRVAFLRWKNALPGCEAFTMHGPRDPRVDMQQLEQLYGPLPTEPKAQNALWYKLYKTVENEASVIYAHKAEPGSGKSHLVKSLAKSLEFQNASAVDYNLASLQNIEDLIQPLDAVRNLKVQDRLPILFLDEFDSDPSRYALLLPLLWDGELNIAHRNLKLGKLIIILAGSGANIARAMTSAKAMQATTPSEGKIVDLLSRVNGGELEIPPLDLINHERDRRVDKICLTISLLEARFGRDLQLVPLSLLQFVAKTQFRYGVRSLAHLIDLIAPFDRNNESTVELQSTQLRFPLGKVSQLKESSLAYHIFSEDGAAAIIESWKTAMSDDAKVRIRTQVEDADDAIPF